MKAKHEAPILQHAARVGFAPHSPAEKVLSIRIAACGSGGAGGGCGAVPCSARCRREVAQRTRRCCGARGDAASRNGSDVSHRGQFQEGEEKARVFFLGSSLCEVFVDGERGGGATKPTFNIERRGGKYELVSKCFEGVQLVGQSVLWVAMAFPS